MTVFADFTVLSFTVKGFVRNAVILAGFRVVRRVVRGLSDVENRTVSGFP